MEVPIPRPLSPRQAPRPATASFEAIDDATAALAAHPEIDPKADSKERLLDAAERLFAEHGFERTSIRAVTQAAGLSVSSANYHFGSKEELLRASLLRRIDSLNRHRLAQLDALQSESEPPSLEAVVACFLRPAVEQFESLRQRGEGVFARDVLARLYTDPPELVARLKAELFGEVNERFTAALARALPGVAPDHVGFLLQLSVGTMVHVIGGQVDDRLLDGVVSGTYTPPTPGESADSLDSATTPLLAELVRYISAGLRANATGAER